MWFVRAKRNKKIVTIPAYNGEGEAFAIQRHLIRYGWITKVIEPKTESAQ
jgi:hypothetical protein